MPRHPPQTTARLTIPESRRDWVLGGILLLGTLYLFAWGIGSYPLWDPWEPKYAQAMREMAERGDYITPYFNDKPRWTKPILIYWAMALPMAVAGNNEFTARLPSALAAVVGVLLTYYFVSRLRGRGTGFIAACVLATLPQYAYMARQAMPDMLLTAALAGAMGFFALGRFGGRRQRLYYALFYVSLALAVLAKGPVAGVIVAGALLLFWLIDLDGSPLLSPRTAIGQLRSMLTTYHVGLGTVLFLAIALPWYLLVLVKHGQTFVDSFVMDENLQRFQEPVREHHGTANFYAQHFFHAMYPWSGFLPLALLFLFDGASRRDDEMRQKWYWVAWCLAVFLLFTLAGTKLDHYILPLAPALAVLVALVWEQYLRDDAPFWVRPAFLVAIPFVIIPIRDFLLEGSEYVFRIFTNGRTIDYPQLGLSLKVFLAAWILVLLLAVFRRGSRVAAALAILVAFGHMTYMTHVVLPAHSPARTMKYYIDRYQQLHEPDAVLVFYGKIRYSMHYYLGKEKFRHFEDEQLAELADYVRDKPNVYIIARNTLANTLAAQLRVVGHPRWFALADEHPRYVLIANHRPETGGN